MKLALAGNPNSGKTSLFNSLTGLKQHVGNWPGKTVEKKTGYFMHNGEKVSIIDLPGTYSLSTYTKEEIITKDYILGEKPDYVINIIDATHLERNLYLTMQLLDLGADVILALNMNRIAHKKRISIDEKKIEQLLGIPVIKIEATDALSKDTIMDSLKKKVHDKHFYGKEIDEHISQVMKLKGLKTRWQAIELLENPKDEKVKMIKEHIEKVKGDDFKTLIADARYGFISGLLKESMKKDFDRKSMSEAVDRLILNKWLGIPIFLGVMYMLFFFTFNLSEPFTALIEYVLDLMASNINIQNNIISSFIIDGVIGGVGSVIVFLPIIMMLFFLISILEDSGYMARAAFLMDNTMHKIGLHGKAFIPFILGFGCTVPAIMATRTLESFQDRLKTMLISPMMSCGARLPVYVFFAGALFSENETLVIFSIYLLGIFMAILMGFIFNKTLFKGKSSPFVMELPPYRIPTLRGALIHMWERARLFLRKAGTVIFGMVIIVWFFSNFPFNSETKLLETIGKFIAPVFEPLGFGFWQASVSLMLGFVAKEVVVGSMGTLFGAGQGITTAIQQAFTPLSAYAFMVFVLLYVPCMTVLITIKMETKTWRWPIFTAIYLTAVAWFAAFIVYQAGTFLGF